MNKIDFWALCKVQTTYLWLLDRTGVYVASLCFMIYAIIASCFVLGGSGSLWLWGPLLVVVGVSNTPRYLMQDKGQNDRYNALALFMQGMQFRNYLNVFLLGIFFGELLLGEVFGAIANLLFILYGYLQIVMIRDRDKKPFFKLSPKLDLVVDRAA